MGPDVHPWSSDLDQPGIHEHLHAGTLQRPREATEVAVPSSVVAGHGHGVAVELLYHVCCVTKIAEHGHTQLGRIDDVSCRDARPHDLHATRWLGIKTLTQVLCRGPAAHHKI